MIKDKYYLKFQLIFFLFISGFGFFFPYFNVYLEQQKGLTGSEIGLIISVSLLTSVAISPLWGMIADKTGKYKLLLKFLLLTYSITAFLLFQSTTFFWVIAITTLLETLGIGMSPMLDILAVNYCEKTGKDFGVLRISASIGWIFGSFVAGVLITNFMFDIGYSIFLPLIICMILSFLIVFFLPNPDKKTTVEQTNEKVTLKDLLRNDAFVFILLFNVMTLALIDSVVAFSGNHLVLTLGADASAIGLMNLVAVAPELIIFIFATRLMNYFGYKKFYIFAVITLILRFTIYALTANVTIFILAGGIGAFMMVPAIIGNVLYIKKHVKPNLIGMAFVLNIAVMTLGRAIFSLIFGVIYDAFGSFMLFKFSMIFFIIALLILLRTKHFEVFDKR